MEITKGENANLAGMEPRCPKCGNGLCVVVDTDPNDYQAYAVAITCQHGACQYKVFPGWDAKDFLPFFRSPAPTPPLDVPSVEEIIKLLGNGWKGFKLGDMDDLMFVVGQIRLAIQKFYSLRRHIASPAQPEKAKGCPECSNPLIPMLACSDFKNCSSLWHVDDPRITNTPRPIEPEPTPASKTEIDSFAEHLATGISGFNNFKGKAGIIDWIRYQAEAWKAAQPLPAPPQSGKEGQ